MTEPTGLECGGFEDNIDAGRTVPSLLWQNPSVLAAKIRLLRTLGKGFMVNVTATPPYGSEQQLGHTLRRQPNPDAELVDSASPIARNLALLNALGVTGPDRPITGSAPQAGQSPEKVYVDNDTEYDIVDPRVKQAHLGAIGKAGLVTSREDITRALYDELGLYGEGGQVVESVESVVEIAPQQQQPPQGEIS
jgi:hypothetical protein